MLTKTAKLITVDALQAEGERLLQLAGACGEHAEITADALVTTDSWGVFTHGTKLLRGYIRRLKAGGLLGEGSPRIVSEGPGWALVDGNQLLGQVVSTFAMQTAIAKARAAGVGYVGVRNSCHFGAAGYYAWLAAREGLVGMAMANDVPSVAAPGSRKAVIGSNPIAYAIPAGEHDPILLDMSIAAVAGGKVFARQANGEQVPEGWLIGPDGQPTCDGSLYPHEAALAPMAGHKGYGLGLLIEVLSGVATGSAVTTKIGSWLFDDPSRATNHGGAFLAIDVGALMPHEEFLRRTDALIREMHEAPTADGCDQLLVPGQREWEHRRQALEHGLQLPADVLEVLEELSDDVGAA